MNRLLIFLTICLTVFVILSSNPVISKEKPALNKPTPKPQTLPEIEKIALDKKELVYICPNSDFCGRDEIFRVKVETTVRNPKNLPLIYEYTVSGGRVVGQGDKVFWDLKDIRPGTYTITVAIDYGRGPVNETKSETVTVKECPICDLPCVCPMLAVSGNDEIKAGETVTFKAKIEGGTATRINYKWTISQGEIIAGQGTAEITVKTTKEMTGIIKATVEIDGDLCEMCFRTAEKTAAIIK